MTLRTFSPDELKTILKKHLAWLNDEAGGERADLRSANLRYADLSYANLSDANLSYADLSSANLSDADLSYADLSYADLSSADLSSADLRSADLSSADLRSANLRYADLRSANLSYANLSGSDLDFSSGFSFQCSSFNAKIDLRIGAQMAYHFCRMQTDDPEVQKAQFALRNLANKFHRVKECGEIP